MVLVQRPRELRPEPLICQGEHLQNHESARTMRLQLVPHPHRAACARLRPVDLDLSRLASVVRQSSRLENPRRAQPPIHTYLIHLKQAPSYPRPPQASVIPQIAFQTSRGRNSRSTAEVELRMRTRERARYSAHRDARCQDRTEAAQRPRLAGLVTRGSPLSDGPAVGPGRAAPPRNACSGDGTRAEEVRNNGPAAPA